MAQPVERCVIRTLTAAVALLCLGTAPVFAQRTPLYQSGTITARDAVKFSTNGLVEKAGGLTGDANGRGLNPFSVTDGSVPGSASNVPGLGFCSNSNKTGGSSQYNGFCFGHDADGNALLTVDSYAGLVGKALKVRINGVTYDFPGSGLGNVLGPDPDPTAGHLPLWNGGKNLKSAHNGTANVIGIAVEPQAGFTAWGTHQLSVGTANGQNSLIGSSDNDLAAGTLALPAGTVGYGRVSVGATGNQAFGMYGLGELFATSGTVVAAEFTARVFSASGTVDTGLPANSGIPNTTLNAKGVNITCGAAGTFDCTTGLHIGNESGNYANPTFTDGLYIQLYRRYGLFIQNQASGVQTTAVLMNNGDGINLQLNTTGALAANNTIISHLDAAGLSRFNVRQGGDIYTYGRFIAQQASRPVVSACGTTPSVNRSNDQAGVITVGSSGGTVTECTVTFASAFQQIPACVVSGEAGSPALSITSKSTTAITVTAASDFQTLNFDYHCTEQL